MKHYTKPRTAIKTASCTIRMTEAQKKQLELNAYSLGVSISQLIKSFLPL